ncbi:hypothetical protein GIB67_036111 [Kingdonia uniflora]|uniref:MULE transposase domain-containing protein n=1 Tax=Kingdonia uniflora TaxID=39325 RepID=A0A7J7N8U0_9MAGN|nr:hypothetical protein GIB67_036111 [Kingdonia uniflora]
MRQFENNEFNDLTKDSFFDNVDAEEDYHSKHTSQDGDDVPTIDNIEDHEGLADNRDFVIGSLNLYEKEDHEDEEPFLPPQALESMLIIGMEWPNIYECRSFMRNFAIIKRLNDGHTMTLKNGHFIHECNGKNVTLNKNANAIWVATEITNLIRDASTTKPMQISDIVYRSFGIQKLNPGSIATCNREDGNLKFTDMYISFKAALDGFTKGCRSILGLEGYFLKGKYGGQCLSIISLDANNGHFPIAVFLCKSECQATWIKFLTLMQGQLTLHPSKLIFISDRQKGLVEAVLQVFPHSNHRFCFRDKPLNKMVERPNLMQMTLMYERKLKAREWDHNGLVPRAVKMIELLKTCSHYYRDIRPPPLLRPAGRPKILMRREADEVNGVVRQPRRCSKCQAFGHNNKTCKGQPGERPGMGRG